MVFKIPDWGFMVPIWLLWLWLFNFQVGFHGPGGFLSFFMVLGGSLWFIKGSRFVIHDFRLVFHGPGGFSSFFTFPGGSSWFTTCNHSVQLQVDFHGFQNTRLVFHGSSSVFMVIQGSRLVFQGSRSVFMIFYSSRSVFMVFQSSRLVFQGSRSVFMIS